MILQEFGVAGNLWFVNTALSAILVESGVMRRFSLLRATNGGGFKQVSAACGKGKRKSERRRKGKRVE